MKNQLIVFDIDDTLYNEVDYVKSGYREIANYIEKKHHLTYIYDELLELFKQSSKNVFNRLFELLNIPYTSEDVMHLVNIYHDHIPNIQLSEEVKDTLLKLKEDYLLAIVSDGNYHVQKLKCEALKLKQYFSKIILTDELGKEYWKPSRLAFDILAREYQIPMENLFYVGDNPNKDFYISQYGIKTIRYYNKEGIYFYDDYKENIKEDYRIDSINELIRLFHQINI